MVGLMARGGILFGIILLLIVGVLAYARRDAPDEWIVYAVNQNSSWWEFYRMRPDGTQRTKLGQTFTDFPTGQAWLEDGWMAIQHTNRNNAIYTLIRLDGLTKTILDGKFDWVNATPFILERDTALLTVYTDMPTDEQTTHKLDLHTYRLSSVELPSGYFGRRAILDNGDMIVWSDHASNGDFYRMPPEKPSPMMPLTTRGDILQMRPLIDVQGWVYFYATRPQLALYRMREDGTDEQLIADDVLLPDGGLMLYGENEIYYWAGDEDAPHLVRANPDGSEPTILPIPFTRGWQVERADGMPTIYYAAYPLDLDPSAGFSRLLLHRLNVETGEDTTLVEGRSFLQVMWTPNQQFLLVWVQRDEPYGNTYELLRMRPDGSESTLILEDVSPFADELVDGHLLVMGPGGGTNSWLRTLDLETFEVRVLKDDKRQYAMRQLLGTTHAPDAPLQVGWLIGIGLLLVGVGVALTRFSPIRQRA